ncbi:MAG: L,D-transpeptidase family protein [Paracoccus sp. (in: a-proteobacteria)]|uniref:L,D-transpeptidase family protein n=1 Tax=Paracoccus sp. TaxID=267 RepID=UPI0026DECA69|nr:L,D-transpeptidase family protein [Paracoccus sp. (in: a-proteobacteria)]MDO5622177.1 L,D-transpeptidase family protein [Paracoccus sp. (in: a-proteobacteria)]
MSRIIRGVVAVLALSAPVAALAGPKLDFDEFEWALAQNVAADPGLAAFYGANGLRPIFEGVDGAARRQALVQAVASAPAHGLPVSRYSLPAAPAATDAAARARAEAQEARAAARWMRDLTGGVVDPQRVDPGIKREVRRPPLDGMLRDFIASDDPVGYLTGLGPKDPRYAQLQAALGAKAGLVAPADAPLAPEVLLRPGESSPQVADLRARLASIGFTADSPDPQLYDQPLRDAVAAYQQAAGLAADGISGPATARRLNGGFDRSQRGILLALERMRWMGDADPMARQVWVNIPEFKTQILDGGQQVFDTRVVVGKVDEELQTPEFSDLMEYVVVNPRWNVPRSITVREYLPRLKANRNAVSHIDIVDSRGRKIDRSSIDFSKYTEANFPYRMQQQPSDDNALGIVKFIFPNPWNIYLHDTPSKGLFSHNSRAYSHGCVRVGDPVDLATQLLSRQTDNPRGMFDRALAGGNERWLKLDPPLPVHLVYFTTFPDETGRLRTYPDIYNRDGKLWQALSRAGLESGGAEG